jgi:hypothetical protein
VNGVSNTVACILSPSVDYRRATSVGIGARIFPLRVFTDFSRIPPNPLSISGGRQPRLRHPFQGAAMTPLLRTLRRLAALALALPLASQAAAATIEFTAVLATPVLGPQDTLSVVAFNNTVEVVIPATRVSDRGAIARAIQGIEAGGGTGLFAGVSKGAAAGPVMERSASVSGSSWSSRRHRA